MDIPNSLSRLAKALLSKKYPDAITYCASKKGPLGLYITVVGARFGNNYEKGSGTDKSLYISFLKAISELGEVLLFKELGLDSRTGLAGGLIKSAAVDRAKAEILERDAFLYHYRNEISFLTKEVILTEAGSDAIYIYDLASSDSKYFVSLGTTERCATGQSKCLILGLGSGLSRKVARARALSELSAFVHYHQEKPNWCESLDTANPKALTLSDFHHLASKDPRNLSRFAKLCRELNPEVRRSQLDPKHWNYQTVSSPLKFFKYCYVQNKDALKMKFGVPEPGISGKPLYHPFW